MPPPCFPPTVCDKVPSFPFTGSHGMVRPLHWYYEDTPTSAVRLAGSLRSPGDTHAASCPFAPSRSRRTREGLGPSSSATPVPNRWHAGDDRPPRFLGNLVTVRLGLGPRWDRHARPYGVPTRPPLGSTTRAPDEISFEARCPSFPSRCLRFAGWVAPPPRKTRFRLLASSAGRGWIPARFR